MVDKLQRTHAFTICFFNITVYVQYQQNNITIYFKVVKNQFALWQMIPNQVWSVDITYIPIRRGFLYLTAIIDWHSRWADNIMIERWFRSFKYEEAYLTQYNNIKEARAAIGQYIHTYNFERRHSALDHHTPAECYYPAMLLPYVA